MACNRLRNITINGSRTGAGNVDILPTERKWLGLNQIDSSLLPANTLGVTPSGGDVGIWQYTPPTVPDSIAGFQVYFVNSVPIAGSVGFQLVLNQNQMFTPPLFIYPGLPLKTLLFDRGTYTSQNTSDYWWLYYQTSSDWNPGTSLITYSIWIYDGIS